MAETSNCTSSLNTEIKTDANSNGCDAWLLFSLHSAPASPSSNQPSNWDRNNSVSNLNKSNPMGKLLCQEARGFEYLIRDNRTIIGRNSSKGDVDVNMGHSTFISRQHLEIFFEPPDNFFLHCMGKNGVFIDGTFQRRCQEPVKLPTSCVFRFPSTNIRLEFQSLVERNCPETKVLDGETERTNHNNSNNNNNNNNATLNNTNGQLDSRYYSSLKVNIPEINNTGKEPKLISPVPSPTGTLSAANSCPTSPGNIGVRFRYANNRQDDFQKMVNYAMSKSEEKLQTNGQNISHQLNNNKGEMKTVPGTMKEFQLTPQPGQPVQFAQHGTPIIANITNTNLILNNGAQLINAQNGQIIATSTPPAIAIKNNHLNQRTKNVQSPTNYTIEPSDDDGKPPYSYAQLIVQAIASAPDKQLTLSGIYSFIAKNYPYYRTADKGWQNSIRHNLSLNRYFLKVPRSQSEPGKGSFWRIDPASEGKLVEQSCKKRRQRPNSGFNSDMPRNSSRSEPTSPSHVTPGLVTPDSLSREPSPVPSQQETIESEIISSGFILQNTDTNNGYPTNKFYSSKSMPGSPGDLTKLQPSQINSVITTTIPISTTNQLANNLIAQSQLTLTNGKLFLDRSLQPSVASSLSSSSSNNVVHQTPTNAAATAAAIALTNLQNKCELSQPSSSSSSNIIQPTVIVQAPSNSIPVVTSASTNEPDNLKPMVICPPTTTVVTVNQTEIEPSTSNNDNDNNNNNNNNNNNSNNNNNNNNNASINSAVTTGPEISSSISNISAASTANSSNTSTAISRPIDLLTSVALAAAADETSSSSNSNITTSTTTTTANVSSIQSDIETNSQTNNDINESTMEKNNKIDLDEEPVSNNKREFDLIESDTGIDGPENKRIKLADDSTVL